MESAKLFFRENPFPATPSPDRFLAIGSSEAARVRLMDSIDRREGPSLIVGPPGTGKTLLCQLLASAYRIQYDVAFLSETRICTRKALLQHLLHHLGLPYSDQSEGELRLGLIDRAATGGPDGRKGVMIIVDEAQALPGRLLEELRMMSGIVRNGSPRVQLVLAGGPSLDERLSQPRMEALSQRIGARCYLHPLGQAETGDYVRDAFRRVGGDANNCVDAGAVQSVYYASNGIIRLINQTMSRAISIAESIGRSRITADLIERAWADLQQLPSPVCEDNAPKFNETNKANYGSPGPKRATTSVVEFGSLDDEPTGIVTPRYDPMAETTDYPEPASFPENREIDVDFEDGADEEIDELFEEELSATANLNDLFGSGFEDEQILNFNAPAPQLTVASQALNDAPPQASAAAESPDIQPIVAQDIEDALHDEIVAINCEAMIDSLDSLQHMASIECDKSFYGRVDSQTEDVDHDESELEISAFHEEQIIQQINQYLGDTQEDDGQFDEIMTLDDSSKNTHPYSCIIDEDADFDVESMHADEELTLEEGPFLLRDSQEDFAAPLSDISVRDDSDLLIIEDDLELNPLPQSLAPRGPRPSELAQDDADFKAIFAKLREG